MPTPDASTSLRSKDQPWLSDKRWRDGKISDRSGSAIIGLGIFALVWNAISWPMFLPASRDAKIGAKIWLIGIFPAVGVAFALGVIWLIVRRLKFGRSTFELETLPGRIGGHLAGTIRTSTILDAPEGVRLKLQCVNRVVTGRGKNRDTTEHVRWEDEQLLAGRLPAAAGSTSIPVCFAIGPDAQPTLDQAGDAIIWRLQASAAMEGADYSATFIVPVFRVDAPATTAPQAESIAARFRSPAPPTSQRAMQSGITFNTDAAGRVRVHFPAGRNKGVASFMTFMALFFLAGGVGSGYGGAPILFPIVFSAIAALVMTGAAVMWFKSRSLTIAQDEVEVGWRMLGLSSVRTIPRAAVTAVRHKVTSQFNSTPFHDITLTVKGEPRVTVATGLRTPDAEWLTAQLQSALGF